MGVLLPTISDNGLGVDGVGVQKNTEEDPKPTRKVPKLSEYPLYLKRLPLLLPLYTAIDLELEYFWLFWAYLECSSLHFGCVRKTCKLKPKIGHTLGSLTCISLSRVVRPE